MAPTPATALDELDAVQTLARAEECLRARRAGEVEEMRTAAHWAALHGEPIGRRDPMTQPGGDGTPALREHAIAELAMARQTHPATTRALIADTLDLQHRLPRTWAQVTALACEPWVARKVAAVSRALPADRTWLVDRAIARAITGHAPATVLGIAAAKVIEADPETHARRREVERHRRYATLSRCDEHGYRVLIARVTAGDAAWLDALLDRVADLLAPTHGHDHNRDELRSLAMGWLARPADLLRLLLDHTVPDPDAAEPEEPVGRRPVWAPHHLSETLGRLAAMSVRQLAALRGTGTVFVHLDHTALRRQAGIARIEGHGPLLVQSLAEVLGHADIRLQPVIDLQAPVRVERYEHPETLKDHTWLLAGGDAFPYAPASATRDRVDFDHPTPYDTGPPDGPAPPGQTGTHNSAPLRRRHHRWKTHGGYRARQAGPGRYLWQTPHGTCHLVDPTGTHPLDPDEAEIILTAPPGVDIYLADVDLSEYG
jgi:hypothetical protein